MPDGLYTYTLNGEDALGNVATQKVGTVLVDTRKPLDLTSPESGSILAGTVSLVAVPPDDYTIYTATTSRYRTRFYRGTPGTAPTSGNSFIGDAVRQPDGSWTFEWDTTLVVNGTYELRTRVRYIDSRGHTKTPVWTAQGTFTVDNGVTVALVSDAPDSFSPNGDNQYDTTTIRYTLSKDADVTLGVYDKTDTLVRTLLEDDPQATGARQVVWNGKNDAAAAVPDGLYTYKIDAVDALGNAAVQQTSDVLVDTRNPLELTSPESGSTLAGTVTLIAVPPGDYTIISTTSSSFRQRFYRGTPGTPPTSGNSFVGNAVRQADGSWTFDWDTTTVVNGTY